MTDEELASLVTDLQPKAGDQTAAALSKTLELEPEFNGRPYPMVRGPFSNSAFLPFAAARAMLLIAATPGKSAADAVAWFRKIPKILRADGSAVKVLYGVRCSEQIALSNDVVLVPYARLPPSSAHELMDSHFQANAANPVFGYPIPYAALCRRGTIDPFFAEQNKHTPRVPFGDWFEELDIAELLLALTPRAAPSEAGRWFQYDDRDIDLTGYTFVSRVTGDFRQKESEPALVTPKSAAGLLTAFEAIKKTAHQKRLRLALSRVIRSRSQLNSGNRAIDLAIALEVLFMNQERDEHSYKISLRVARLLRSSLPDRLKAFAEVKKVYDIRSGMVHTGSTDLELNVNGTKRSAQDIVEAADLLCAEAIRRFLELGHIPESDGWREIELA